MHAHRSFRRSSASSSASGSIVAFLLIACFGLLFVTGCSSVPEGPGAMEEEEDTFTAEDVARFRELAGGSQSASGATMSGQAMSARQETDIALTGTGSGVADPALRKKYDALRAAAGVESNVYRVTNEFLNVRAQPNVSAASAGRLVQGDVVGLVEFVDAGWAKITMPGGREGFVATRYIAKLTTEERLKEAQKQFEGTYFVDFAFVNVRKSPDTGSDKLGEIPGQAFVKPIAIEGDWARIAFQGKEGYVSMQFLSPFRPNFLVRQDRYPLPILHYTVDEPGMLEALVQHASKLKQSGVRMLTFRDLYDIVQTQEVRDARIPPRSILLSISGVTPQNVKKVSDALFAASVPATLFLPSSHVGVAGISEKVLLTLQANGFDIQSGGHTGDDLRTLTNAQTQLELQQSRLLLEQLTHKTVFAVAYPQGGANDRVLQQAADAGYLFGLGGAPDGSFSREQFLRLPSYTVTAGMTGDDVVKLVR